MSRAAHTGTVRLIDEGLDCGHADVATLPQRPQDWREHEFACLSLRPQITCQNKDRGDEIADKSGDVTTNRALAAFGGSIAGPSTRTTIRAPTPSAAPSSC